MSLWILSLMLPAVRVKGTGYMLLVMPVFAIPKRSRIILRIGEQNERH